MMDRVAPLAIDSFVNELAAEFQKEPELSLGDRVIVFRGRRHLKHPQPAVVIAPGRKGNTEYQVKLANGDIKTFARGLILRREEFDRIIEVMERPVT